MRSRVRVLGWWCAACLAAAAGCASYSGSADDGTPSDPPSVDGSPDASDGDASVVDGASSTDGGAKASSWDGGLRAFVTSASYYAYELTGAPENWDKLCNDAVPGSRTGFAAWVSRTGLSAKDWLGEGGPWERLDRVVVAGAPLAELRNARFVPLRAPLDRDELGVVITPRLVWTGTLSDGTASGNDCSGWTELSGIGLVGRTSDVDGVWTAFDSLPCQQRAHIYCFERP